MFRSFISQACLIKVLLFTSIAYPIPVQAQTIKQVNADFSSPLPIGLAHGYGVSIDFRQINQRVVKVWLDNPSFATLSVDGCLEGLDQSCENSVANILHLRRIDQIEIPGIVPTTESLLTVVTDRNQIFLFKLTTAAHPGSLVINLIPNQSSQSAQQVTTGSTTVDWFLVAAVERAINKSIAAGTLVENSLLHQQLSNFHRYLKQGMSEQQARSRSGISTEIVQKLKELGNYRLPSLLSQEK